MATRTEFEAAYFQSLAEGDTARAQRIADKLGYVPEQPDPAQVDTSLPDTPAAAPYAPNLARQFYQGFTMGTGDEAEAALRSVLPGHQYGEDISQIRGEMQQFEGQNPVTTFAADFAGGMLSPVNLIAPGAGIRRSLAQRIAQTAARGGAEGAVEGAARTEGGMLDRLQGGLSGGMWGTALGPAFEGIVAAAPALYRAGQAVLRPVFETAEETAERMTGRMLRGTEVSPEDVVQSMEDIGPTAMLADLNPSTRELAVAARARSDVAGTTIDEAVEARQAGARERITGYLEEAAGQPATAARDTRLRLQDEWQRYGREQYPKIERVPIDASGEIQRIMETPFVQPLVDRVRRSFQSEYRTNRDPFAPNEVTGTVPLMSFQRLKQLVDDRLIELDQRAVANQDAAAKDELRVLGDLRKRLVENLDRQAPEVVGERPAYKAVREGAEEIAKRVEALDAGSRLARTRDRNLDDLYERVMGINDPQTQTFYDDLAERNVLPPRARIDSISGDSVVPFRQGAVESLARQVDQLRGQTANPARSLLAGSEAQDRLALVAASPEARDVLESRLIGEVEQHDTMRMLNPQTGSRTAILEAATERADESGRLLQEAGTAVAGDPMAALGMAFNRLRTTRMTPDVADELASLLTRSDISLADVERLMDESRLPPPVRETVRRFMARGGERAARTLARQTAGRLGQ